MINLDFQHKSRFHYGIRNFATTFQQRIKLVLIIVFLFGCQFSKNKPNSIEVKYEIIQSPNNKMVVFSITNNSNADLCFLNFSSIDKVFVLDSNLNEWLESTEFFFSTNLPPPKIEDVLRQDSLDYSLEESFKSYPEYYKFYSNCLKSLRTEIANDYYDFRAVYLYAIFNNAVFVKKNQSYLDTIDLTCYNKQYPQHVLKVVFNYPNCASETNSLCYVEEFRDFDWVKELKFVFPDTLDGYKLVWGDIKLSSEVIFDPN